MSKALLRALNKYVDQAANEVKDEEEADLRRVQALEYAKQWQQQPNTQAWWGITNSSTSAQSLTQTIGSTNTLLNQAMSGACGQAGITLGGAPSQWSGLSQTTRYQPTWSFTDEQMEKLLEHLKVLLARGWECVRCHRIWSPQESGCEFCNFIDRLEGKDVDHDTAA